MLRVLRQRGTKIRIILQSLDDRVGQMDGGRDLELFVVAGKADVVVTSTLVASSVLNEALYDAGAERSRTTMKGQTKYPVVERAE